MPTIEYKRLTSENYHQYYAFRLESLQQSPQMYATDATDWKNAPREIIEKHLTASESSKLPIIGAWHQGKLIGMAGLMPDSRPTVQHKATVWGLYVFKSHRRQGIGAQLLANVIATARELGYIIQLRAVVNTTNQEALRLFQKGGFQEFGTEPRAKYVDGSYQDQIYIWLPLDK